MLRRVACAVFLSVVLVAGAIIPTHAGGWATVELDETPALVEAGVAVTIGFTILQHGVTPFADGTPFIEAIHRTSGAEVRADGRADGALGHYVVEVTLPEAGEWAWTITADPFPSTVSFPALSVVSPGGADTAPEGLSVGALVVPRCGITPTPMFQLDAFERIDGRTADAPMTIDTVLRSESVIEVPFADFLDRRAAIAVLPTGGDPIACGQVLAEPIDGVTVVGLAEVDGSGWVGIARITDGDGAANVEILLAPGLTDPGTSATTAPPATVVIEANAFGPATLEIAAGTAVTWVNHDQIVHEVALVDIALDDSGLLAQNERFTQVFETPGTYEYVCGPHPGMVGTVVVR